MPDSTASASASESGSAKQTHRSYTATCVGGTKGALLLRSYLSDESVICLYQYSGVQTICHGVKALPEPCGNGVGLDGKGNTEFPVLVAGVQNPLQCRLKIGMLKLSRNAHGNG